MLSFTKEDYMKEVEGGYVTRRIHPENENVVILNYTDLCVYERHWNDVTLQCRGLIIDESTGEVLARPFKKFFNYGEVNGLEQEIPQYEVPVITTKMDGSLGIMYRLNGEIRWATRGSFVSEQAKEAQRIWDKKYSHLKNGIDIGDAVTVLVEIISPDTRVVVDYNGMEDLVILGVTNRYTGEEFPHSMINFICKSTWGMPVTERVKGDLAQMINKAKNELSHNEEGYVFHWEDAGLRLKVKGSKYMEVHRIIHGMSDKQKFASWANGNMKEYIKSLPEEFREELEEFEGKLNFHYDCVHLHIFQSYLESPFSMGRKDFAVWVNENIEKKYIPFMFMLLDNKPDIDVHIKKMIADNYKEIMGEL